jgi:hypothetical protein
MGKKSGFLAAATPDATLDELLAETDAYCDAPAVGWPCPSRTLAGAIGGGSRPASHVRPRLARITGGDADEIASFWLGRSSSSCRHWSGFVGGHRHWPRRCRFRHGRPRVPCCCNSPSPEPRAADGTVQPRATDAADWGTCWRPPQWLSRHRPGRKLNKPRRSQALTMHSVGVQPAQDAQAEDAMTLGRP